MSDVDLQKVKIEVISDDEEIAGWSTSEIQSTDLNQRVNKNAERNRLYRERHKEEINQRRRQQRRTVLNIQNVEEIKLKSSSNKQRSKSHIERQQRYYERHREEINKRKRDKRKKNDTPIATTAAERSRVYREKYREQINQRRRERRREQNEQRIDKSDVDAKQTEAANDQNSSNDDTCIIQNIAHNVICAPKQYYTQFEETQRDRIQSTEALRETQGFKNVIERLKKGTIPTVFPWSSTSDSDSGDNEVVCNETTTKKKETKKSNSNESKGEVKDVKKNSSSKSINLNNLSSMNGEGQWKYEVSIKRTSDKNKTQSSFGRNKESFSECDYNQFPLLNVECVLNDTPSGESSQRDVKDGITIQREEKCPPKHKEQINRQTRNSKQRNHCDYNQFPLLNVECVLNDAPSSDSSERVVKEGIRIQREEEYSPKHKAKTKGQTKNSKQRNHCDYNQFPLLNVECVLNDAPSSDSSKRVVKGLKIQRDEKFLQQQKELINQQARNKQQKHTIPTDVHVLDKQFDDGSQDLVPLGGSISVQSTGMESFALSCVEAIYNKTSETEQIDQKTQDI